VTQDDVAAEPSVAVHHGLGPNDPVRIALYHHRADVICLCRIVIDADLRRRLADGAGRVVETDDDARINARRLIELLLDVASHSRTMR
jgi:hypothetical protein